MTLDIGTTISKTNLVIEAIDKIGQVKRGKIQDYILEKHGVFVNTSTITNIRWNTFQLAKDLTQEELDNDQAEMAKRFKELN